MPGFNGTGPRGAGPMSGHGKGYCIIYVDSDSRFKQKFCRNNASMGKRYRYNNARHGLVLDALPTAPVCAPQLNDEQG